MYTFKSMVVCRKGILCSSKHDSHRKILDGAKIWDNSYQPDVVKVNLVPQDNKFEDLESYTFKIAQPYLPEWWNATWAESKCRQVLKRIMKNYPVEFPGDLIIDTDIELPKLESVGGCVEIWDNSKFKAPKLKSVGGDVSVGNDSKFTAPNLKTVSEYVFIRHGSNFEAPTLESVDGYVVIWNDVKFEAPQLKTIGGYVSIWDDSKFKAPKLESVGGGVGIGKNAKFEAPQLKTVNGEPWTKGAN